MDTDKNLNNCFYKDLDTNFEQAFLMSEKDFSHDELIRMLKSGNIPQRQIAGLKFDYVKSVDDAEVLLSSLTKCDGKIREAVALRINQILTEDTASRDFFKETNPEIFADATIDINANICRLALESAVILKIYKKFSEKYTKKILDYTWEALAELEKFIFRDKKYVINKQLFKLYWCLEAINCFAEFISDDDLEEILTKCTNRDDYTIREKTAQIVHTTKKFPKLRELLEKDDNYYVRQVFKSF